MQTAYDFRDESLALHGLIDPLGAVDFARPTQFNNWTLDDILQHLHFFNVAADRSLMDEAAFEQMWGEMQAGMAEGGTMVSVTNDMLDGIRGRALLKTWRDYLDPMTENFAATDPKKRLKWAGPDMSARSSITARLMETWAHGQEVHDLLGVVRENQDRIKNITVLGVNTFGWTFINRGEEVPDDVPHVRLTAPSGALWEWNAPSEINLVEGPAEEFCQVVTQTRNIADTSLRITGETATRWMAVAQCFAGEAKMPPAPGTRGPGK